MAEQWLIDGEQLFELLSDQLANETGAFSKGVNKGLNIARSAIHNVDAVKPIDPESLPIVRQLREELEREKRLCDDLQKDLAITADERDAALERVKHHAGCWECKVREEGKCAMPFFKDECSDWEWRGPRKEE